MTKAVIDLLGESALMHQSDYPHGEAYFPDTAAMVLDWPFWKDLGRTASWRGQPPLRCTWISGSTCLRLRNL